MLEDATGAIELYLAAPSAAVRVGARLRVTGTVGRAWGAPRLHASAIAVLGTATPSVLNLHAAPGAATEWRLVRVSGVVKSVHKSGDRWIAELDAGSFTVPVTSLSGSGIPATAMVEGRRATVVGIVKRPYPTASDRRHAIVPRAASDIALGAAASSTSPAQGQGAGPSSVAGGSGAPASSADAAPIADLRDLASRLGQRVRVGGLVTELQATGFRLDDGTATASVVLAGSAAELAALVGPGDALDAVGRVELRDGAVLVVDDAADVTLVGDLGGADPSPSADAMSALSLGSSGPDLGAVTGSSPRISGAGTPGLWILGVTLAILGAALVGASRRLRARRATAARLRRRLAAMAGPAVPGTAADA
ncbi:MAG: hypothetical protein U0838_05125 [Chloroflexota bacterium]